jgi:hypothetical protein
MKFALALVFALLVAPVSAQSLADAAKHAQEERAKGMGWPAPVPPKDIAPGAAAVDPAPPVEASAATPASTTSTAPVTKDEAYWKGRMRAVTTRLHDDSNYLLAAETNERALNTQVHRPVDHIDAIASRRQLAVVENQWQDSVKEVARLQAAVKNDTRAKADLELEAHRAGVPPGWLILE